MPEYEYIAIWRTKYYLILALFSLTRFYKILFFSSVDHNFIIYDCLVRYFEITVAASVKPGSKSDSSCVYHTGPPSGIDSKEGASNNSSS